MTIFYLNLKIKLMLKQNHHIIKKIIKITYKIKILIPIKVYYKIKKKIKQIKIIKLNRIKTIIYN